MSETVNIRLPGVVDLTQYRVQVGDTVQFIEKINNTQADLENWAQQLTFCATDLQAAADQIGTRHTEIVQTGTQVADDKAIVQQLRTETGEQRQLAETAAGTATQQAGIATGAADTASQAASTATAAQQAASTGAGISSQAATVSTQQRQLAEAAAQQAEQSAIEAGPTNLSLARTATTVTVQSSTGDDATLPAASTTEAGLMSAADKRALNGKQQQLVSGSNIRTVNGQSILGSGNITITPAAADVLAACATAQIGTVGSYVWGGALYVRGYEFNPVLENGGTVAGGYIYPAGFSSMEQGVFHGPTGMLDSSAGVLNWGYRVNNTWYNKPLNGTWRFMGRAEAGVENTRNYILGLFLRIA